MTRPLTFGILGVGQFGSAIRAVLDTLGTILWAVTSESDHTLLQIPDWVFIATPNTLHYEQAHYFLRAGAHVFVEKPATLDAGALEDLIALAKERHQRFYVDDVFLYRSDFKPDATKTDRFVWHKRSSPRRGSLLDRFAYHHLYMLFAVHQGQLAFEIDSCAEQTPESFRFEARVNGRRCTFSYGSSVAGENVHVAFGVQIGPAHDSPLSRMFSAVLTEQADFDENHRRALWVTGQISRIKKAFLPTVAVVGGGIFGSTVAIELADQGYNVVLHERHQDLLEEASSINQYRVHHGYHYPRSRETAEECKASSLTFIKHYRQAIVPRLAGTIHQYAIASRESLTKASQFVAFMDSLGLAYRRVSPMPGTDLTVEVEEELFDSHRLASIVKTRLRGAGVELRLGRSATEEDVAACDYTVIATYASLNDWCSAAREYQFELCEKPVLRLPEHYRQKSIVVLDGPFMCIDPMGDSGFHVMGNVVHAIHHSNVGLKPVVPNGYEAVLNKGIIENPPMTRFRQFIESARPFFPDIDQAEHIGSMFTFRTVQPNREKDDARPTLIEWVTDNRVTVFSGKICTCVSAARTVVSAIDGRLRAGISSGVSRGAVGLHRTKAVELKNAANGDC